MHGRGATLPGPQMFEGIGSNSPQECSLRIHNRNGFRRRLPGTKRLGTGVGRHPWRRVQFQRLDRRITSATEQLARCHSTHKTLGTVEHEDPRGDRASAFAETGQRLFYREVGVEREHRRVGERSGGLGRMLQRLIERRTNGGRKTTERIFPNRCVPGGATARRQSTPAPAPRLANALPPASGSRHELARAGATQASTPAALSMDASCKAATISLRRESFQHPCRLLGVTVHMHICCPCA